MIASRSAFTEPLIMSPAGSRVAKSVEPAVADANKPDLCLRSASQELVCSRQRLLINGKLSAFHVNSDNLAVIVVFDLCPNLIFVNRRSSAGVLFFAERWLT